MLRLHTLILCTVLFLTLTFTQTKATAAEIILNSGLVSYVNNLDIDGQTYDVSIVYSQFIQSWQPGSNWDFASSNAPIFWQNPTGAQAATQALIDVLSDNYATNNVWDSHVGNFVLTDEIVVPYDHTQSGLIVSYFDQDRQDLTTDTLVTDQHTTTAACIYATFTLVPEPTTATILLSLSAIPLLRRHRKHINHN
ncbi:hypothetical protein KS4_10480 [Poriferisphaera corsica]|uniref:Uncharacterized protein n=1 Tax=Poriferisphaera corsica TaxID=2528020 RepID=A0A517YS11_9BACT|nr:hypothetical protein [Poriferisphaera corsica]QDU33009.1 hypothetical protein KS4_10480 [Poriferisphaera corsica]